jgi:uncharacterized protein (TIGR02001 family)
MQIESGFFTFWEQYIMNTIRKAGLAASLLAVSSVASAEWSANLGFASEYYFRGIPQKTSSASGGIDYDAGGFYAGTWAADVGDGLEVDVYGGYGFDISEDFSLSIGGTGYFYTGDFDTEYLEVNLGAAYGIVSLDVAVGQHELDSSTDEDYTYYALTVEKNGFYGTFAGFSQDWGGEYLELGYGTTVAEIDLGVSLILCDEIDSSDLGILNESDEVVVFTIGKSFDL